LNLWKWQGKGPKVGKEGGDWRGGLSPVSRGQLGVVGAGLDRKPLGPPLGEGGGVGKADADVWGVGRRWPPLVTLSQLPGLAQNPLLARRFLDGPFQVTAGPDGPLPALHRAAGSMSR
jgi:hypothetical protein